MGAAQFGDDRNAIPTTPLLITPLRPSFRLWRDFAGVCVFRFGTPDDQQFADMLHRGGVQSFANGGKVAFPRCPVVAVNPDFDEFVRFQAYVDFFQYGVGKTVLGDGNNGREGVRLGA